MELIIISALAIGVLWLSYSAYKSYVAAKAAKEAREESDRIAEEELQHSILRTNERLRSYTAKAFIAPTSSVSRTVESNSGASDPFLTYLILSQSIQPNSYSSNPHPHASSFPVGGGGTFDGAGASADWSSSSSPSSSSSCDSSSSSSYSSDSSSSSSDSSSSCSSSD